ncbi:uncharacterized protein LOC135498432 isoform X2 [Lineus longissimus]|uniref:uncharacterized protein LOC135498432 isoform X2 n=1 Tax=Lineus longissimus TaxID=88925 RepID=UPI00315CAD2A
MAERSIPKLAAMGTTAGVLTITVIFNILAMGNPKTALFTNTTGSVYDYYTLEIVPASWTLITLWAIIYIWQVLWIGYALSTICRKSASGPLYLHPAQMSVWFYAFFIANNISNIIWQIVWDRFLLVPSLVFLALVPLTLNGCLVTVSKPLSNHQESLIKEGLTREVWMIHLFVENGILVYIAWTEIATLINAAMVMHYLMGVAEELACTIVLDVPVHVRLLPWGRGRSLRHCQQELGSNQTEPNIHCGSAGGGVLSNCSKTCVDGVPTQDAADGGT